MEQVLNQDSLNQGFPLHENSLDQKLHKLPQNYFMQQDDNEYEEEDMEKVIQDIQQMREQILDQVKEGDQKVFENIQSIIEPKTFIEKHKIQNVYSEIIKEEDILAV